ncbi:hypothetical protein J437_LFUL007571 [Ladona fulva]|uniref:Ubiquitin carboxyl-terminal hydrolase n=1 Tax=Ladona fulva TaxID=123851 RepID=A0A8K0K773_LADFU|nr:hypothetical protein J437_LFUL007571 [Ladona fulva]
MEISYKHPPIILERGYFDWVNTFPMMTTNPHIKTPIKTKSTAAIIPNNDLYFSNLVNQDDILDDLDDVEYPALIDSPPKVTPPALDEDSASIPKVFPSATKSGSTEKGVAPVVDRSSKPAVLSSPKASPVTPTITKKPVLPVVPVELTNREIPKEIVESKSDSEVMMEKAQPEPSNVNRYVENEDENKVAKEEIRLSPKIIKDDVKAPSKVINEDAGIPPKITNGVARMPPKIIKDDVKSPPTVTKIPVVDRSLKAKVLQQQVEEEKGQPVNMETRRGSKEEPDLEESRKPSEVLVKQNSKTNYLRDENKEVEKKQPKKKVERDEWHVPINFEPSPGSSMKRSRSFQNVSRLMDDQECPKVNRSVKPISKTEVLSVRRRIDGVYGNVGRGLTGLRNLGNSCYMNSILQCISHTTILMKYFCDGKYRDDVNRSTKMKGEVAEEVAALVRALWGGDYRSIACRGLKGVVGMHKEAFAGYEQQDSHEFLTILMDWLHEDLNRAGQGSIQKASYNSEGSNQNASGLEGAVKAWKEFCSKNESLVLQLFYGQQASTVRCLKCGEESVTYEPFSNLSLPIPPNATRCTLSDCMSLYLKGEVINGWNCPRCKEPRDAVKKFDIWILPEILVIHFKRFTSDGWCRKKQTMVDFPLEDLDVSSWVTMDSTSGSFSHHRRNTLYNLYGVSNHYGTIDGGHYTAHCKSSVFHKWYKFDDHEVSELSPSDVVSPAAYILFYSSVDVS